MEASMPLNSPMFLTLHRASFPLGSRSELYRQRTQRSPVRGCTELYRGEPICVKVESNVAKSCRELPRQEDIDRGSFRGRGAGLKQGPRQRRTQNETEIFSQPSYSAFSGPCFDPSVPHTRRGDGPVCSVSAAGVRDLPEPPERRAPARRSPDSTAVCGVYQKSSSAPQPHGALAPHEEEEEARDAGGRRSERSCRSAGGGRREGAIWLRSAYITRIAAPSPSRRRRPGNEQAPRLVTARLLPRARRALWWQVCVGDIWRKQQNGHTEHTSAPGAAAFRQLDLRTLWRCAPVPLDECQCGSPAMPRLTSCIPGVLMLTAWACVAADPVRAGDPGLSPPAWPRVQYCVLMHRANITCYWEPGEEPHLNTTYTLNVDEARGQCDSIFEKGLREQCTPLAGQWHCTVSGGEMYNYYIVTVTARDARGSATSPRLCLWNESGTGGKTPRRARQADLGLQTSSSATLCLFSPFTRYSVQLRTRFHGNSRHWSEWSSALETRTEEAAPAVGPQLWRREGAVSADGRRRVTLQWKPLLQSQANGKILGYNVTCCWGGAPQGQEQQECGVLPPQRTSCVLVLPAPLCSCSLSAFNAAGHSPPARIALPDAGERVLPPPMALTVTPLDDSSLSVRWTPPLSQSVTGFVVEWCPLSEVTPCVPHWLRLAGNVTETVITEAVEPRVRYNVSVRALRQGRGGAALSLPAYSRQGAPSAGPRLRVTDTWIGGVALQWDPIPIHLRHGFIRNYTVCYCGADNRTQQDGMSPVVTTSLYCVALLLLGVFGLLACLHLRHRIKKQLWPVVPDPANSSLASWTPKKLLKDFRDSCCQPQGLCVLQGEGDRRPAAVLALRGDPGVSEELALLPEAPAPCPQAEPGYVDYSMVMNHTYRGSPSAGWPGPPAEPPPHPYANTSPAETALRPPPAAPQGEEDPSVLEALTTFPLLLQLILQGGRPDADLPGLQDLRPLNWAGPPHDA
nr:PREDICTED: granulocyte colony-stimulating factor receptor-like [Lepisosteus oculatus]